MEFHSLPLEIHLKIFSYLPARDVMSIRRVCKLWNGLINGEIKFKRLRCQQLYDIYLNSQSYDFGFTSTRSFLDHTSTDLKFSRVRYLDVDLETKGSELEDAFNFLNSFKSLEEAWFYCRVYSPLNEIEEVEGIEGVEGVEGVEEVEEVEGIEGVEGVQKQFVVSLPRLKKASFYLENEMETQNVSVLLDLPNLICLSINSLARITIGYPEKLRTLVTESLFGGQLDYSKFTSLTNIFTGKRDLPSISASFLERLPSLRELHVNYGDLPKDYRLPEPSLSKASPKIFYLGFEVSAREIESEGAQWPDYIGSDSTGDSARFIARYLHRSVDNNRYVYSIDYNTIAGELDDTAMFAVLPQKFLQIHHLRISGTVSDKNRLLKFIDKLKVPSVDFERTSLPQRFFGQLAENCPFISSLAITEPTMSILSGDFNFAFNFKNLRSLRFRDCPLSLDFVARALKELKQIFFLTIYQPESYCFSLSHYSPSSLPNLITLRVEVNAPRFKSLKYKIPTEEAAGLMNALHRQLNVDGAVCPKELLNLLSHLNFEKENALFWMRKYLYDQRHSICLSEQQMRLLNLRH